MQRNIKQLAVYEIDRDIDLLPFEKLRSLYINKTSEIIYITKNSELYGIICLGDVLRQYKNGGKIRINKDYTALTENNVVKAYEIFKKRKNIYHIPIINEKRELVGDFSCWNDLLFIERNYNRLEKRYLQKKVNIDTEICVVKPIDFNNLYYLNLLKRLLEFQVKYIISSKEELGNSLADGMLCIFLTEDEKRGVQCLYGLELDQNGKLVDERKNIRFITYANLLNEIMQNKELDQLNINNEKISYSKIDQKTTYFLKHLNDRGVKCFCLYPDEQVQSDYAKKFKMEIAERVKINPMQLRLRLVSPLDSWPKLEINKKHYEEFYLELSSDDAYKKGVAQKEILLASSCTFEIDKNIKGKYFNAKDGRRITCFQPDQYIGTIYLLGPCMIIGAFNEDKYTIGSWLQKKLLMNGYKYRVENYGAIMRNDSEIESRLSEIEKFDRNDIVIILSQIGEAEGIPGESLEKIFEKNKVPSTWVTNGYVHCNHKVNELMADSVFELIESSLIKKNGGENEHKKIHINVQEIMADYIKRKYLNCYFANFHGSYYNAVGAIVMNCNPFSKGHRYLIEQAMKQVDFLIIFVVEEDESLFPFEERFKMIVEGTKDLENVMIVPSGDFIISSNTFQEYFMKEEREINNAAIVINADYDINIFADYIAKPLHITHRFAGEEPFDNVTKIYNDSMRRILPRKGISFVEIPRSREEGIIVSASRIRKYLKDKDYEKALTLMPETTKEYLGFK